ncbi:MAG: hypothetical protein IKO93_12240 [Lentisphaeria bacterium]|nr:hypothetical protein [Lentisphaeria bacterium]
MDIARCSCEFQFNNFQGDQEKLSEWFSTFQFQVSRRNLTGEIDPNGPVITYNTKSGNDQYPGMNLTDPAEYADCAAHDLHPYKRNYPLQTILAQLQPAGISCFLYYSRWVEFRGREDRIVKIFHIHDGLAEEMQMFCNEDYIRSGKELH